MPSVLPRKELILRNQASWSYTSFLEQPCIQCYCYILRNCCINRVNCDISRKHMDKGNLECNHCFVHLVFSQTELEPKKLIVYKGRIIDCAERIGGEREREKERERERERERGEGGRHFIGVKFYRNFRRRALQVVRLHC